MTAETKHLELYKKYRPQTWDELIGQEKTARSLQAATVSGKIPTAYLFSGDRGTGKTSSALLLAKSLNCEHATKDGNPCNICETCVNIEDGTQVGVNYESMANRGSVDDVRNIVQRAMLNQPLKQQIWILDEVHNLSRAGFDALLIPLESKNMPSLFILCSTEIDKIPATITSRVQQRRFSLVKPETMLQHVSKISEKENLSLETEELKEAVRRGRGSVRDTLTALEAISTTGDVSNKSFGGAILEAISEHNLPKTYAAISEAVEEGNDGRDLAEQLFTDLKNLLLLVAGVDKTVAGMLPLSDLKTVAKGMIGQQGIIIATEELADSITHMTLGADSRIHFEIAVVKIISKLKKMKKIMEAKN